MSSSLNNIEKVLSRLRKQLPEGSKFFESNPLITPKKEYSLVKFILGEGNKRKALISAGIHGDEPGGIESICAFLENNQFEKFSDEWELTFLPCLNPYGYEYGTRENHEGNDLNRHFKDEVSPHEVAFAKSILENFYELTIELHEDFMSSGYYLYQLGTHPEDDHLGNIILQAVKEIMPINLNGQIDDRTAKEGIMVQERNFSSMDWWPMAYYSLFKGSRRCLTLETATKFPLNIRIEAHLIAINTALIYFSGTK